MLNHFLNACPFHLHFPTTSVDLFYRLLGFDGFLSSCKMWRNRSSQDGLQFWNSFEASHRILLWKVIGIRIDFRLRTIVRACVKLHRIVCHAEAVDQLLMQDCNWTLRIANTAFNQVIKNTCNRCSISLEQCSGWIDPSFGLWRSHFSTTLLLSTILSVCDCPRV
jgi:hypothetical protein